MVADTLAAGGPEPAVQAAETDATSTLSLTEYMKIMDSRFNDLTEKYEKLASKQLNKAAVGDSKNEENKDVGKEKEKDNKDNKDKDKKKDEAGKSTDSDDVDENIKLTPELNRLTWVEWRKVKTWEANWEAKTPAQKKKDIEKRRVKLKKFVIDVVADTGDLGLHATADRPVKEAWTPGRIRINSEHVIDALNEIASITVPTPCQILHPFKPIIDFEKPIREHMKILEDNLEKAKNTVNKAGIKGSTENTLETPSSVSNEKESKDAPKAEHSKGPKKAQPKKSVEEEDVELAEEKCSHYRCFLDLLDTNLAAEIKVAASIRNGTAKKIMFSHLWHLFVPGDEILFQDPNRIQPDQLSQILKVSGGRARLQHPPAMPYFWWAEKQFRSKYSAFTIDSFHLDFDGNAKKFRLVQNKYKIPRFSGDRPIDSLKVYPVKFLTDISLIGSLLKRGENLRSLASVDPAHREYHGMSLDKEREEINGRIIVDFKLGALDLTSDRILPEHSHATLGEEKDIEKFGLKPLTQTDDNEVIETGPREDVDTTLFNDHTYDIDRSDKLFLQNRVLLAPSQELDSKELTEAELRLLPGTAVAYVLRSRKYCKCDISLIETIKQNESAFEQLVLPKGYHTMIRSLVDKHSYGARPVEKQADEVNESLSHDSQNDANNVNTAPQDTLSIVKGKGRGLIILLHGVPGVGKTSTAETIADATGRPLLSVTCGDVGESAAEVEKNLELIFTNSHRWGCVLLLDEAEVFLAKRSLEDLKRNALVSVFLRILEYYSGILFLTTNRVGTIDEAFKSRIHISLYYPQLNWPTTKAIWQVNLNRSTKYVSADDTAILSYAKRHYKKSDNNTRWNGRQIYNAFKTAIALSQIEQKDEKSAGESQSGQIKPILLPQHFRQVAHVSREFDQYLLSTHGESMAALNKQHMVRDDSFGLQDGAPALKRRSTRLRQTGLSDVPSDSEVDSESDSDEDLSDQSEEESSEEEQKQSKKKRSQKSKSSGNSKKKEKKSSKKKKSKKESSESSDE